MNEVFISHAIGDPDWPEEEVKALAEAIRAGGAKVWLDYWHETNAGRKLALNEWREWMRDGLEAATHVLVLASPAYVARAEDRNPQQARGRGVVLETSILDIEVYDLKQRLDGWISLCFPPGADSSQSVPRFLKQRCPEYTFPEERDRLIQVAAKANTGRVGPNPNPGPGQAPLPATAVPAPLPVGQPLADRLSELRAQLQQAFALIRPLPAAKVSWKDGLPEAVQAALDVSDQSTAGQCLDALIPVFQTLTEDLNAGRAEFVAGQKAAFREAVRVALGLAARASLNLDCIQAGTQGLEVPADSPEGAAIVARPKPHHSWASSSRDGIPGLRDKNTLALPMDLGEGDYARQAMARELHSSLSETREVPQNISEEHYKRLRARARTEALQGRERVLAVPVAGWHCLQGGMVEWLAGMNIRLVQLQGDDGRLFSPGEYELLDVLHSLWQTLDQPPWHNP